MDAAVVALIGTLSFAVLFKVVSFWAGRSKSERYDVNKVRSLEMEIWGEHFTPLPEAKKELPKKRVNKCTTSRVPLDDDGWCSNGCVKVPLTTKTTLRSRRVTDRAGYIRRVPVPTEVPDCAHAMVDFDPRYLTSRIHWKWTDPTTGRQKGLVQMLPDLDLEDIGY